MADRRSELLERMPDLALLETTKVSQSGLGRASSAVMISTDWPLCSWCDSGARLRSTRHATQRLPTSVCTA